MTRCARASVLSPSPGRGRGVGVRAPAFALKRVHCLPIPSCPHPRPFSGQSYTIAFPSKPASGRRGRTWRNLERDTRGAVSTAKSLRLPNIAGINAFSIPTPTHHPYTPLISPQVKGVSGTARQEGGAMAAWLSLGSCTLSSVARRALKPVAPAII